MDTDSTLRAIQINNENFIVYIVMVFIILILIFIIGYIYYLRRLQSSECDTMNDLYPSINGYIRPISTSDPDCSGCLYDYYIKTAYNACSGGDYTNDFVDICNLKSVIKQGVRGLDFELFSIDNEPVVATSTSDSYYIKQTFNSVKFADVMSTIKDYGFADGTSPNPTDPIIIHLRCMSTNQDMYDNLASIFANYDSILLGSQYSFESQGKNFGAVPLVDLMNKCVIIIDKTNTSFLENEPLLEYVNMLSNSVFMRTYNYTDVANNQDVNELTLFNKRGMTIVFPDNKSNPTNPSSILCMEYGCQMVAMRFQYVDNYLEQNTLFFDRAQYAFALKPQRLRYVPIIIKDPTPQKESYSYATRKVGTDFYSFNY
jgi:hypothetical protein